MPYRQTYSWVWICPCACEAPQISHYQNTSKPTWPQTAAFEVCHLWQPEFLLADNLKLQHIISSSDMEWAYVQTLQPN